MVVFCFLIEMIDDIDIDSDDEIKRVVIAGSPIFGGWNRSDF